MTTICECCGKPVPGALLASGVLVEMIDLESVDTGAIETVMAFTAPGEEDPASVVAVTDADRKAMVGLLMRKELSGHDRRPPQPTRRRQ
jgi:hypothetical protein